MSKVRKPLFATAVLLLAVILGFSAAIYFYQTPKRVNSYVFNNSFWTLEVSSFIHSIKVKNLELAGYWGVFHYEEHSQLQFATESSPRFHVIETPELVQLIAYSELRNSEMHKVFTFYRDKPLLTVTIQKGYLKDGFLTNNQLMIDLKCSFLETNLNGTYSQQVWHKETRDELPAWIKFHGSSSNLTLTLLEANPDDAYLQLPSLGYINTHGSGEVQLNFHSQRDEDLGWRRKGEIEKSAFSLELE